MKKRVLALLATAIMVVSSTVMTFADTTTGLIGQFKFDGDLSNSVEGAEAGTPYTQGNAAAGAVGTATEHTFNYVDGVDGSAIYLNEGGDTTGINLNIKPTSGKAYTISVWAKSLGCNFANPLVWAGKATQGAESSQCWVGIWPQLIADYTKGPCLGSVIPSSAAAGTPGRLDIYPNDKDGVVYGAGAADAPATFEWMNITITVNEGVGCLYYNGTLVGMTNEQQILPDIIGDGDDTVSIYVGANAWDAPFNGYVDNVYVYDRVLSAEDVKELVTETNVNGVALAEFYEIEGPAKPIETTSNKPTTANRNNVDYLVPADNTTAAASEDGIDPTIIIIAAVVVVVIVVVVVVAVVASKKKSSNNSEDDDE